MNASIDPYSARPALLAVGLRRAHHVSPPFLVYLHALVVGLHQGHGSPHPRLVLGTISVRTATPRHGTLSRTFPVPLRTADTETRAFLENQLCRNAVVLAGM